MTLIDNATDQFEKFKKLLAEEKYDAIRDPVNYDIVELTYPFGKRLTYQPKNKEQISDLNFLRGVKIDPKQKSIADIKLQKQPNSWLDAVRITELNPFLMSQSHNEFLELGFREPKLLEYYKSTNLFKRVRGVDVVEVNVAASLNAGYDVELSDLNRICESDLDLSSVTLCISYHCFEHLYDSFCTIQEIVKRLGDGCTMHFEVPIEGHSLPRIRYGHLFSFEKHDLTKMLELSNVKIIRSRISDVERVLAKK